MTESSTNLSIETDTESSSTVSIDLISNAANDLEESEGSVEYDIPTNTNLESVDLNSSTNDDIVIIDNADVRIDDTNTEVQGIVNPQEQIIIQNTNNIIVNNPVLLKINQISIEVDFPWRVHAIINFRHATREYTNAIGAGEVTTWDLVDETGSINLVAFNLQSNNFGNTMVVGRCYELCNLSIRTADQMYKTLPNDFQLLATSKTTVRQVEPGFVYVPTHHFVNLEQIENLSLNSIIDVRVLVLRDYGTTTGFSNNSPWTRRELHIAQNGYHTRITLWNEQARQITTSMVNLNIELKNVKIGWFNGSRNLVSLANTRLSRL